MGAGACHALLLSVEQLHNSKVQVMAAAIKYTFILNLRRARPVQDGSIVSNQPKSMGIGGLDLKSAQAVRQRAEDLGLSKALAEKHSLSKILLGSKNRQNTIAIEW
ncbi:hypothetical protein HHI36_003001 [Cryptolaemus montrouzieri]|uniref:Uncharacterized protein n=1 Tax=Cryptolaemus montrouzieri TaxID=559131 RepID=A0ABD2PC77_9CUCU